MKFTNSFILIVLILVPFAFFACGKGDQQQAGAQQKMPAVPVTVGTVVQKDVPVVLKAVGTVEAFSTVTVRTQVGGILNAVNFKEGDEVKKGDLLFSIDPRPAQSVVAQAEANLAKDRAQAQQAQDQVKRYQDLVKKDFVTQEQFDQIKATAAAEQASMAADEAALQNAKLQLAYCSIHSPIDGKTGSLMVHAGNVVKVNDTELVSIQQVHPINVTFALPEKNLADLREHMNAGHLMVQAAPSGSTVQQPVSGTLDFINNIVDRQTGTIQLKANFENREGSLWPGQFVDVNLTLTTTRNAIVVPSQAVQTGQQGEYVFVVKPDLTVDLRPVEVASAGEKETVIAKGLTEGERVVTDGQLNLIPGAHIEIKKSGEGKVS